MNREVRLMVFVKFYAKKSFSNKITGRRFKKGNYYTVRGTKAQMSVTKRATPLYRIVSIRKR